MDNKLKAAGFSAGALAAASVIAWVCWLTAVRDSSASPSGPETPAQIAETPDAAVETAPGERNPPPAPAPDGDKRRTPGGEAPGYRGGLASRADRMPVSMIVAGATLIVRGKHVDFTTEKFTVEPSKVLYGRPQGGSIAVYAHPRPFREYDRQYYHAGEEGIFFLSEFRKREGPWRYGIAYYAPPTFDLDGIEREVRDAVTSGAFLVPPSLEVHHVGRYLQTADRAILAELTKLGADRMEWEIAEVLCDNRPQSYKGKPVARPRPAAGRETIAAGLEPWQLRAEAIVRHQTAAGPDAKIDDEAVRREFQRLVKADLTEGQKAILFVREPDGAAPHLHRRHTYADVAGLLKGDAAKPLDEMAAAIRQIVATGQHQGMLW